MSLLTGSANCIRNILFAFNLAFVITGIVLIALGSNVTDSFKEYKPFLVDRFFSIPTFLIVIGSFIFVIAFFGCYGAYREQYCMLLIFSSLLTIIFIFELSAGIAGYVLRGETVELVTTSLTDSMQKYNKDKEIALMWDTLHTRFNCCGTSNYTAWVDILNTADKTKTAIPISCCSIPTGTIGEFYCNGVPEELNLRATPCIYAFSDYISKNAVSLGAAGIAFAVIQLIGIVFACYIGRELRTRQGISGLC